RITVAENGAGHELAAEKAKHVPVARIATGDPHPVLTRHAAHDRQEVEHKPEDPGPAIVDANLAAEELRDERVERLLYHGRRLLDSGELGVERLVAEAAGDEPPVGRLVPVVETMPAVVRHLEEPLFERLCREDLSARRDDQTLELAKQPARISVG